MRISNYEFKDQIIILDANEFEKCSFDNCRLIVQGFGGFKLIECKRDNCKFEFAGPAAMTLNIMGNLYHQGGKDLVENAFKHIREAGNGASKD